MIVLQEKYGLSDSIRGWSNIIKDKILLGFPEDNRIIINGYEYPEKYNDFSVDYFVIDLNTKYIGYNDEYSGYDKDGNYVVVIYVTNDIIKTPSYLYTALNHEIKHAYQDYMRQQNSGVRISDTKESKEIYTKDFIRLLASNNYNGPIKEVLKMYYYTSDLEFPAYMENIGDGYYEYINIIRSIINKDFSIYLNDSKNLEKNFNEIKEKLNIPYLNKFTSGDMFIKRSINKLKVKAENIFKRINKLRYGKK
jgi:hypothetical protein